MRRFRLLWTALLALASLGAAPAALADSGSSGAFMTKTLTSAVNANPSALFQVIVKGKKGVGTSTVSSDESSAMSSVPAKGSVVRRQYSVINGTASTLSGKQILKLASNSHVAAILQDVKLKATGSNLQIWPQVSQVTSFWTGSLVTPAVAIVDSGVDASRAADFGARVLTQQNFVNGNVSNLRGGDGYGHGTFVASIAAGGADGYTGAAPGANIVSLDVLDDTGAGNTSDVIDAADWIFKNKDRYGIRVANFSLCAQTNSSFMYDALDQAVEKLWLNGVVVVAASGNYASNGQASGVVYAPGNDPFAITVGAADLNGTTSTGDDFNAPWSAYGYTNDGFLKPELGAPGRYVNGAAPTGSAMYTSHPERAVATGYMWMSGTSFAAPVVSGAAADVLAAHPGWTSDQVKGALMLTAAQTASAPNSLGVGEVRAQSAANVANPPNPNAGLDQYVVSDQGNLVFDAASWAGAAQSSASWNSASWNSASWAGASWNSASWAGASWSSASWASASWASGQTTDGTMPNASWSSLTWVG